VILYQMLAHGKFPFGNGLDSNDPGQRQKLFRIENEEYEPLARNISSEAKDLVRQLLTKYIKNRLKNELSWSEVPLNYDMEGIDAGTEVKVLERKSNGTVKIEVETKCGSYPIKLVIELTRREAEEKLKYKTSSDSAEFIKPIKGFAMMRIRQRKEDQLKLEWRPEVGVHAFLKDFITTDHPILCVNVRNHPWFKDFDWDLLERGKYTAPWLPDNSDSETMEVSVGGCARVRQNVESRMKRNGLINPLTADSRGFENYVLEKDSHVIVDKIHKDKNVSCHIIGQPEVVYKLNPMHLEAIFTPWRRRCQLPTDEVETKYVKNKKSQWIKALA